MGAHTYKIKLSFSCYSVLCQLSDQPKQPKRCEVNAPSPTITKNGAAKSEDKHFKPIKIVRLYPKRILPFYIYTKIAEEFLLLSSLFAILMAVKWYTCVVL